MSDKDVAFSDLVHGRTIRHKGPGEGFLESQSLFVKSIDTERRQITALASSPSIDRHDEVILPEAFREFLPVYMKNPVVITTHQHRLQTGSSSVVGNVVKAWLDKKGFWVVIEFVKGTALGDEYWLLYSTKKQRALSVGFIPMESEYEEHDGRRILVHTKVEPIEISCVPVPANREALSKSKQHKRDFIQAKRYLHEEEKILADIRAAEPDFDLKCEEFGEALVLGTYDDLIDWDFDGDGDKTELDCVKALAGKGVGPDCNSDKAGEQIDFSVLVSVNQ